MEPLVSGKYPKTMIENVTDDRLPKFTNEQAKLLIGSYDFLGLNYYVSQYATTLPPTNIVSMLTDSKVLEQPGIIKISCEYIKLSKLQLFFFWCIANFRFRA